MTQRRRAEVLAVLAFSSLLGCGGKEPECRGNDAGPSLDAVAFEPDAPAELLDLFVDRSEHEILFCHGVSMPIDVVLANASAEPVSVFHALLGTDASAFRVLSSSCVDRLAAGSACVVTLDVDPRSTEGSLLATLHFEAGGQGLDVSLVARAATCDAAFVGPTPFNFGDVRVGERSEPMTFWSRNLGDAIGLPFEAVTLGGLDGGEFEITYDGCLGHTLEPGRECEVDVRYAPRAPGIHSGTLQITGYDTGTVSLQGRGMP